ncbi:MAG: class I SAM-dependent methyltransferase [Caldilineaceae bacterium]
MIDHDNLENYLDPVLEDVESTPFRAADSWLLTMAQAAKGAILELGSGTGRLTIPLAQQGIDITGLEVVPQMLNHARAKAGTLPIRWVQADVRNFHLDRSYPLIFTCGGVISHLLLRSDQELMLRNVRKHLAAGGHFVLDSGPVRSEMPVDTTEETWYSYIDPQGRQVSVIGSDRFDPQNQIWHQTFFRRWQTDDGFTQSAPVRLALHYWHPGEVEALLTKNGFQVVTRYQDWTSTLTQEEEADSIFVCR